MYIKIYIHCNYTVNVVICQYFFVFYYCVYFGRQYGGKAAGFCFAVRSRAKGTYRIFVLPKYYEDVIIKLYNVYVVF